MAGWLRRKNLHGLAIDQFLQGCQSFCRSSSTFHKRRRPSFFCTLPACRFWLVKIFFALDFSLRSIWASQALFPKEHRTSNETLMNSKHACPLFESRTHDIDFLWTNQLSLKKKLNYQKNVPNPFFVLLASLSVCVIARGWLLGKKNFRYHQKTYFRVVYYSFCH